MANATGKVSWRYSETSRTKDSVELYCPKRKYEVRLLNKRMELKKDGKWTWVANWHWDSKELKELKLVWTLKVL